MSDTPPNERDPMRCGAKRRDGGYCRAKAMPNGRCRMHGGTSTGPKVWTAGGTRSKKLAEFREHLKGRARDPGLLGAGALEKIALLDEAEHALMDRALEEGDTPEFRQRALKLWRTARTALRGMDEVSYLPDEFAELGVLLEAGVGYDSLLVEASKVATKRLQATTDLRRTMATESAAQERLAFYAQQVMRQIYDVVREMMPPGKGEEVVRAVHQALVSGRRVKHIEARAVEDGGEDESEETP